MASTGQCAFISDLLDRHGLTAAEMAERASMPEWERYEVLPVAEASEVIDWLQDLGRE